MEVLPDELVLDIIKFLSPHDLTQIGLTCKLPTGSQCLGSRAISSFTPKHTTKQPHGLRAQGL